jgi:GNAT superfamily N-acetyltransferase
MLWMVDCDDALVKKCEQELRQKLDDPYYYEAMQRIRRDTPRLFGGLSGAMPPRGAVARWLQWGGQRRERRLRRGRPPTLDRSALDRALFAVETLQGRGLARSVPAAVRLLLRAWYPAAPADQVKRAALRIAQDLYEHRSYVKAMLAHAEAEALRNSDNSHVQEFSQVR